jgi:hypothetical protein
MFVVQELAPASADSALARNFAAKVICWHGENRKAVASRCTPKRYFTLKSTLAIALAITFS